MRWLFLLAVASCGSSFDSSLPGFENGIRGGYFYDGADAGHLGVYLFPREFTCESKIEAPMLQLSMPHTNKMFVERDYVVSPTGEAEVVLFNELGQSGNRGSGTLTLETREPQKRVSGRLSVRFGDEKMDGPFEAVFCCIPGADCSG